MKFNWHELDHDSFLSWMVINLITDQQAEYDGYEALRKATNDFTQVDLVITINGIPMGVEHFVEAIRKNMTRFAEQAAREQLSDMAELKRLRDSVVALEDALSLKISDYAQAVGLELDEDRDWG